MKPVRVRIYGRLVKVPDRVVKRGTVRRWVRKETLKRRVPPPTFNQMVRKEMARRP